MRERKIPRDRVVVATKVTGPSSQMTWIRGGPKSLDANNILEAIDNSYVPMFGETEYDPSRQYASVAIEEQLGALGKAVDAGRYSEGESRYNLSNPILKSAVQEYADIAGKYGFSPASLSIAFVLKHPLVASAVFGATKAWQLREVFQASKIHLTMEIIAEINKVHERYPNPCP
uniref:Uncharacterized protein LOC105059931 isoform X2 n=1 Tax=Elaeis guineensis var. tenera TaxID=51953 RepID=A0A6J0PSK0_ELAGV|nr:uncharacterized protein LOC105059931 isoform X2 [Elaeis guineensis]